MKNLTKTILSAGILSLAGLEYTHLKDKRTLVKENEIGECLAYGNGAVLILRATNKEEYLTDDLKGVPPKHILPPGSKLIYSYSIDGLGKYHLTSIKTDGIVPHR